MPNGHDSDKKYGEHKYTGVDGTQDCNYHCGCYVGPSRSGGPIGLDPFGICPSNPEDGKLLGRKADRAIVVEQRIRALELRASTAEEKLKSVAPGDIKLAEENTKLKKRLDKATEIFNSFRSILDK